MRKDSVVYTVLFAGVVCVVCAIMVSSSAVSLADLQDANKALYKQRNVLEAAGLVQPGEAVSQAELDARLASLESVVVKIPEGEEVADIDPLTFDQEKAKKDPERSHKAPPNNAGVFRIPDHALVYKVTDEDGALRMVVLPIEGYGLWSTLKGFLALDADTTTIRGLTYYEHKETPGLGGEVDNPKWKALWPGRKALDANWEPEIEVIKGNAPPPSEAPYKVDGLSGATITSRGVTNMIALWLGPDGFGPYLENLRAQQRS